MDILGQILWCLVFGTPLITIPLVWKFTKQSRVAKVLIGLALALILSFFLFHISLAIIFRDGMGP